MDQCANEDFNDDDNDKIICDTHKVDIAIESEAWNLYFTLNLQLNKDTVFKTFSSR